MLLHEQCRDQRSHTVAVHKHWQARMRRPDRFDACLQILYGNIERVEIYAFTVATAVTAMVMTENRVSPPIQVLRDMCIAPDVFADAMHDINDGLRSHERRVQRR